MSIPGISGPSSRANRLSCVRSESSASPAPGYCTLTATSRPSCHTARCTCPIEAAAAGFSSNSRNNSRQSAPIRSSSTAWTVRVGIGGAASWSLVRAAR